MKRIALSVAATGALALGVPAAALAASSSPPNCFGQLGVAEAATSAPGFVGQVASGEAQSYKGPSNGSVGQDFVPMLKETCVP